MHRDSSIASQEIFDEIILVDIVVALLIFKVSHDMALLFPKVDQFLKLHLPLGIKNVGYVQVVDKPLSFEFLSDLRLDVGDRHIQLVQVAKLLGVSDVSSVQVNDSLFHVRMC